jgi:hypothetical protein
MVVFAIDPLDVAFPPPRASDHAKRRLLFVTKKAALAPPPSYPLAGIESQAASKSAK